MASDASGTRASESLVAAGIGALMALLLSCLVGAYLQDVGTTLMFGVTCGCLLAAVMRTYRPPEVAVASATATAPAA
jgi:hypothetical protein